MSVHWTKTPEGKAKMAKAQRKAWKTRKAKKREKQRSLADRAVKAAVKNGRPKAKRPPRMAVRVLSLEDGVLSLTATSIRTWGEFIDLMTRYEGIPVEQVTIERRR